MPCTPCLARGTQDTKAPFGMSTRLPHQGAWLGSDTAAASGLMVPPLELSMADAYTYSVSSVHGLWLNGTA